MPWVLSGERAVLRRVRRFERRKLREFRDWIENTRNLIHVSILIVVSIVIAFLTVLANAVDVLPFLLFPPLAAGTYTLFAVARTSIEAFLDRNAGHYDIVFPGASTDRSGASRFIARPPFQRIHDLDCDIGIVHRG